MPQASIWDGSSTFTTGSTPFGFYDTDSDFQTEADNFAKWCAKRLGYPLMNVELQDKQFYACLEESVSEYSAQINQFNIKDNLLNLKGQPTGSNFTHKRLAATMGETIKLSKQYGTDVDIIKLDVEGRWYEMLSEILDLSLPAKVVLCECEMNIGDSDTNFKKLNTIVEKFQTAKYQVWINRILRKENIELVFTKNL